MAHLLRNLADVLNRVGSYGYTEADLRAELFDCLEDEHKCRCKKPEVEEAPAPVDDHPKEK